MRDLLSEPNMHIVLACAAMNPDPGVDPDHLVSMTKGSGEDCVRTCMWMWWAERRGHDARRRQCCARAQPTAGSPVQPAR